MGAGRMPRILYIEDDKAIAGLVKAVVEKCDHTVDIAPTGADGLAMQDDLPYDAIAVDYQLPDMTGIDICRQLLLRDPDTPIVMITGMGDQRLANEALGLGVMNYVQKDTEKVFLELLPSIFVQLLRKGAERKERARLREELELYRARMEDASHIAKLGFWEWDVAAERLSYMSPQMIAMMGYTPDTLPEAFLTSEGDNLCIHPDDLEEYRRVSYGVIDSGSNAYDLEYRLMRPDGVVLSMRQIGRVGRDQNGVAVTVFGVDQDISDQKKAEEALRESEERFRDFSEVGNDWHWELDEDLCYIELSPSGDSAELYPSGHYLGQSRAAVRPEGVAGSAWQTHLDDLEAHRPFRNFIQPRHLSDGTTIWLSVSGKPLFGPEGEFRGYRGTAIDVSQQKRNEDALLEAQRLAKVGSWRYVLDQDVIVDCSEELALIHGYSRAEFLDLFAKDGKGYRDVIHPEDVARHYTIMGNAIAGKRYWENEFRIIRKDGEVRHVKEHGLVELDIYGNVVCTVGSIQDITEQKRVATELEEARAAAETANLAKSDFLSSMSHELRTPLNAILGFSQLMEYNPQESLTEAQQSAVDHIRKGGEHLLSLINDILDLARIEAGKTELSIEDVRILDNINECMALVRTLAEKRDIEISIRNKSDDPQVVRADSTRLAQVVLNLLSNAIKYNRRGGRITIELRDVPDDCLWIGVTDTGPGIPEEKYEKLFQPFSRLGAESTETEGTGIGLVVTKELVELMNGRIGFESALGVGSTFWVELPKSTSAIFTDAMLTELARDSQKSKAPSITGKILYVEDNPANLALMEQIIATIEGLSIISAHNAEFGIELAKSQKPNLIIFDVNLPGMSGLEAIRKLKEIDSVAGIPVIALSAAATQKDIQKGLGAGFDHYLTKPINVAEITETINRILLSSHGQVG